MGRTTFDSSVRSRGGRREDDGVSTGGMLMSVVVSTQNAPAAPAQRAFKIGGDPNSGEDLVLPKGSVIVNFQKISAADAGASVLVGTADDPNGIITVLNAGGALNLVVAPNGALVTAPSYLTGGLSVDSPIFSTNGGLPPTIPLVGILTYFVYDDGTSGTR
jgi:hypothetical protein